MRSRNPAQFRSYTLDEDGYLSFRVGGNLRPRITFRPSAELVGAGQTTPDQIRQLFNRPKDRLLQHYWDMATIVEDGQKRTIVHADPE